VEGIIPVDEEGRLRAGEAVRDFCKVPGFGENLLFIFMEIDGGMLALVGFGFWRSQSGSAIRRFGRRLLAGAGRPQPGWLCHGSLWEGFVRHVGSVGRLAVEGIVSVDESGRWRIGEAVRDFCKVPGFGENLSFIFMEIDGGMLALAGFGF
jgi:hypothetical protein